MSSNNGSRLILLGGCPKQTTEACSKQDDYTPYLSYDYLPEQDKFRVRIKMNYSKKKRGIRVKEDFKNIHELATCVKTHGVTRRNLASLLMGTYHDPLGIVDPYAKHSQYQIGTQNCKRMKKTPL